MVFVFVFVFHSNGLLNRVLRNPGVSALVQEGSVGTEAQSPISNAPRVFAHSQLPPSKIGCQSREEEV